MKLNLILVRITIALLNCQILMLKRYMILLRINFRANYSEMIKMNADPSIFATVKFKR
jgi:hypothetical protein